MDFLSRYICICEDLSFTHYLQGRMDPRKGHVPVEGVPGDLRGPPFILLCWDRVEAEAASDLSPQTLVLLCWLWEISKVVLLSLLYPCGSSMTYTPQVSVEMAPSL